MFIGTDLPKFTMKSQLRSKTRSIGMPPVLLFCRVTEKNTLSHSTLNSDELLRAILNVNPQFAKFQEFVSFLVTLFFNFLFGHPFSVPYKLNHLLGYRKFGPDVFIRRS